MAITDLLKLGVTTRGDRTKGIVVDFEGKGLCPSAISAFIHEIERMRTERLRRKALVE